MARLVRIGLVGCGTIGSRVALAIQRDYAHAARITALHDRDQTRALALRRRLAGHPPILPLSALIQKSQLVIEAASGEAAATVVPQALRRRRDVLVMSVGGLLTEPTWRRLATRFGAKVYVPSGALAGLDGVKALGVGRIHRLSLTTRKPPRALASAAYVLRRGLRLDRIRRPSVVFEGSAEAAVAAFPQNTNVAAALALAAGVSARRPRIRVLADPTTRHNIHELEAVGDCGRIRCRIESRPSANPKTSELAVRSAIATLRRVFDPLLIGT